MAVDAVEARFKDVVDAIGAVLKPAGFTKRGLAFRHLAAGNSAVVAFQRSQSSSRDAIRFTLNLGIICGRLLADWQPSVSKAGVADAHLRARLGAFLPGAPDRWWIVDATTDTAVIVGEIADLLTQSAVPFVVGHLEDSALRSLWQTGSSPGLTEGQRARYLRELEHAGV
jgi:hypothetical protein